MVATVANDPVAVDHIHQSVTDAVAATAAVEAEVAVGQENAIDAGDDACACTYICPYHSHPILGTCNYLHCIAATTTDVQQPNK